MIAFVMVVVSIAFVVINLLSLVACRFGAVVVAVHFGQCLFLVYLSDPVSVLAKRSDRSPAPNGPLSHIPIVFSDINTTLEPKPHSPLTPDLYLFPSFFALPRPFELENCSIWSENCGYFSAEEDSVSDANYALDI